VVLKPIERRPLVFMIADVVVVAAAAACGGPSPPLATSEVEFMRKVVVLAPGFGSALASRFAIFGEPAECATPADPQSIREALICLGFRSDEGDSNLPGATIVDMSWAAAPCLSTAADDAPARCIATIARAADGRDVIWQPAAYDLGDPALSMLRQQQVDLWGHRLAETLVTYDRELRATAGYGASFYLIGHSLGGQVVVRTLRAVLDDADLAAEFEGDNHGRLRAVIAIDGALNWTGQVSETPPDEPCGVPVRTVAEPARERDNVAAVEDAFDRFGTLTVAITSAADPVVGPAVALLREPAQPSRGYDEALFHDDDGPDTPQCTHSTLLWPEPSGYPLAALLAEHVGPAAGE
jgi:pimeloyl-ACP methyl ester carboxylesterase